MFRSRRSSDSQSEGGAQRGSPCVLTRGFEEGHCEQELGCMDRRELQRQPGKGGRCSLPVQCQGSCRPLQWVWSCSLLTPGPPEFPSPKTSFSSAASTSEPALFPSSVAASPPVLLLPYLLITALPSYREVTQQPLEESLSNTLGLRSASISATVLGSRSSRAQAGWLRQWTLVPECNRLGAHCPGSRSGFWGGPAS